MKNVLTQAGVRAKMQELSGNLAAVARAFGVTRQAVWDFVNRRPKLTQLAEDLREGMKDHAESALQAAVLRGEGWAVCFYLKCQAKERGYIEKQDFKYDPLDDAERFARLTALFDTVRERAGRSALGNGEAKANGDANRANPNP